MNKKSNANPVGRPIDEFGFYKAELAELRGNATRLETIVKKIQEGFNTLTTNERKAELLEEIVSLTKISERMRKEAQEVSDDLKGMQQKEEKIAVENIEDLRNCVSVRGVIFNTESGEILNAPHGLDKKQRTAKAIEDLFEIPEEER